MALKPSGLILVHHAAEMLLCHPRTIVRMINAGKIEGFKAGRKYLVQKESVLKYLEENKVTQEKIFA